MLLLSFPTDRPRPLVPVISPRFHPLLAVGLLAACAITFCGAQPTFTNVTAAAGLTPLPGHESIAVGDFNNDGYEDLYLGFPERPNQLWKNQGDGTFVEMAADAGIALAASDETKTAIWGDVDNDGDLDLYVGNRFHPDRLLRNNGDETFTDISSAAGVNQVGYPLSVNMADIDRDGWLDIYVSNFLQENVCYRNNGDGTFTNLVYLLGATDTGPSMGSLFFDYDRDGDPDLYLVHDTNVPNLLYRNDGTGRFTEVGAAAGANTASNGMGVDLGDFDNDGWPDLYIANLFENLLLRNNGDGTFSDVSAPAGVDDNGMGWGTTWLDYDNDGREDIYVANEYQFSPYPNVLYRNTGAGTFVRAETDGPVCNQASSYGTARFDYNADGYLDLVVANRDSGVQLFQNAERPGNWLALKLIGVASNRQAVGVRVSLLDSEGTLHYRELTAGSSWLSQQSSLLHFGLGPATAIQEMTVYWPSGQTQSIESLAIGRFYTIVEGAAPREGISFGTPTATADRPVLDPPVFRVAPNPSDGRFQLSFSAKAGTRYRIEVTDPVGRILYTQTLVSAAAGVREVPIELDSGTAPGIAFVNLTWDRERRVRKVLLR